MRIFFCLLLLAGMWVGFFMLLCVVIPHCKISTTDALLACIAFGVLFPKQARNLL